MKVKEIRDEDGLVEGNWIVKYMNLKHFNNDYPEHAGMFEAKEDHIIQIRIEQIHTDERMEMDLDDE